MIVGPFTGEVGYELLYWLPYLRHTLGDEFKNATAVTRGGSGIWYPCKTIDGMDLLGTEAFRRQLIRRHGTGQKNSKGTDDPVDSEVLDALGMKSDIHPRECKEKIGSAASWPYERLPEVSRFNGLPDEYVAVRVYTRKPFVGQDICDRLKPVIKTIAKNFPVVVLVADEEIDDHGQKKPDGDQFVHFRARDSLETISKVVSHARHFICTYGGLSYLGPMYRTPTTAVAKNDKPHAKHGAQEDRMAAALGSYYKRVRI